jgi:hypothetical protein
MKKSRLSLFFALSIVLSGCVMQKRSIMPGWHFEMSQNSHEPIHTECPEKETKKESGINYDFEGQRPRTKPTKTLASLNRTDPLIPIKSLMAHPLQIEIDQERRLEWKFAGVQGQEVRRTADKADGAYSDPNYVLSRLWKLYGAISWSVLSIIFIFIAGDGGGWLVAGVPCSIMATRSFRWIFASNAAWAQRKASKPFSRSFFPRTNTLKEPARKEAIELQNAENKRIRAELKASRRAKRQAFLQAPSTKIALGFLGILAGYALLF